MMNLLMSNNKKKQSKIQTKIPKKIQKNTIRPNHKKDDLHAHIKFGEDPKPMLKKYGYCVVENVYSKKTCTDVIDSMWDWLTNLGTGIDRTDSNTWVGKNWPFNLHRGLIQHTLGQEEFMWKIREHKNTIKVFSQIYGTKKLLTSMDGANIGKPCEVISIPPSTKSWIHTDQNIIKDLSLNDVYTSDYYSIQGVANFETSGDNDASLFIGEKTHTWHNKLFKYNKLKPINNWFMLRKEDIEYLTNNKIKFTKVNAAAGSLLLFDSRCFHSGYPHQKGRDIQRFRYVIYTSLTPYTRATDKDLQKKQKAVKEGRLTSHWSSCNVKVFPLPRTYGNIITYLTRKDNIPNYEKWSLKRKKLAGLVKY